MRLMCHHPRIALGVERFNLRVERHTLDPSDFEYQRFFDCHRDDTWYKSLDKFRAHYESIRPKYRSAIYVGDKMPRLYRHLDYIFSRFPNAKVLFIKRDLREVMASYERRIGTPDWSPDRNATQARIDWTEAMEAGARWEASPHFCTVLYPKLTDGSLDLNGLCSFLDVEPETFNAGYAAIRNERL
jgi:hypothetical protein